MLTVGILAMSLVVAVSKAARVATAEIWKSAQELTVINAGPWPVSEPAAGGMLRRLPFAAKDVVRSTIYRASEDTAGLAVRRTSLDTNPLKRQQHNSTTARNLRTLDGHLMYASRVGQNHASLTRAIVTSLLTPSIQGALSF